MGDNSKKLCEKLQIKKTDQGKACVVGDTVGDPFKDTSGPALNILIKLMSMVSLTIAPLLRSDDGGNEDWESWYFGFIPLVLFAGLTVVLAVKGILTWKDPLAKEQVEEPTDVSDPLAKEQEAEKEAPKVEEPEAKPDE